MLNSLRQYFVHSFYCPPNVYYLRNWQVTFLLYTLGAKITEYIAKASMEPRDYRVVFLIQKNSLENSKEFTSMQVVGLEPTRCCHQRILSPHRLPFRHAGVLRTVNILSQLLTSCN